MYQEFLLLVVFTHNSLTRVCIVWIRASTLYIYIYYANAEYTLTVVQQLAVAIATLEKYVWIVVIQAQRHEGLNCYSIRIPTTLEYSSSCSLVSTDNYRT